MENFLKLVINKLNLNEIEIVNERAEIYSKKTRENLHFTLFFQ